MTKLLHIVASPREDKSRTLQISQVFLEELKKKHPEWLIEELNLMKETLPDLSIKRVDGKYMLLSGKQLFGDVKEAWEEILAHIHRFLSADLFLISTPMWNFSIPYMLKQYIDLIVQPGYLFRYTSGGSEGLVKNKKMVIISSSGGQYQTPEMIPFDHLEPYLRTIFGFVGIKDFMFIKAGPMDLNQDKTREEVQKAQANAVQLAQNL